MHRLQIHHRHVTRFLRPASVDDAVRLLDQHRSSARLVAGATDLLLELDRGGRRGIDTLIDIGAIPGADEVVLDDGVLRIGFRVTHGTAATSPVVADVALPLAQASAEVGSPQLRNRATIVGNLVTASPANDTISALMALDATVHVQSARGARDIAIDDLYDGFRSTTLSADEMVIGISVPCPPDGVDRRAMFAKLGLRRAQSISVVHLSVSIDLVGLQVTRARMAMGSVAPTVIRLRELENALVGQPLDDSVVATVVEQLRDLIEPISDIRGTADYRRETAGVLLDRTLRCLARAEHRDHWFAGPRLAARAPQPRAAALRPVEQFESGSTISAMVNGSRCTAPVDVSETLLDWLRAQGSLRGTKEGCAEGECGACTVVLDGAAVMACLVPAPSAAGATITTVEGIGSATDLHPIQRSFMETGAAQCGFCTPGFIVSGSVLIDELPEPTDREITAGLSGNICRCTGYYSIIESVRRAARGTP